MTWRSPCARSRAVDRAVHVRLADSLHSTNPEVAENLRATSPHYSGLPMQASPPVPLGAPIALIVGMSAIWIERQRQN
jgi:hypothetical protein